MTGVQTCALPILALFETLGNAEATSVVTHCVNALGGPVTSYEGTVVKTLGDGLMAVFDDPLPATQAAMLMHDVLEGMVSRGSERGASSGLRALRLQVGLARGEVVEMSGDCFGDAVNVAARLLDHAGRPSHAPGQARHGRAAPGGPGCESANAIPAAGLAAPRR